MRGPPIAWQLHDVDDIRICVQHSLQIRTCRVAIGANKLLEDSDSESTLSGRQRGWRVGDILKDLVDAPAALCLDVITLKYRTRSELPFRLSHFRVLDDQYDTGASR